MRPPQDPPGPPGLTRMVVTMRVLLARLSDALRDSEEAFMASVRLECHTPTWGHSQRGTTGPQGDPKGTPIETPIGTPMGTPMETPMETLWRPQ